MINRLRCAWLSTHIRKHLNIPPFSSRSTLLLGSTDPATGRPLRDQRIVPNPALRAIIAACNPSAHPPPGPWLNCYIDQESCSELVCESRTNHIDVIWLSHKMNDAYFRHFTKASTRFILRWHDEMQPTLHQGACLRVGFALVTTACRFCQQIAVFEGEIAQLWDIVRFQNKSWRRVSLLQNRFF